MVAKVLIMGGTRYFGKELVKRLLSDGYHVSLMSRGKSKIDLNVHEHIIADRYHLESMRNAFKDKEFDLVYDQICYDYDQATLACEIFKGKVGHYIFTSSMSVYGYGDDLKEEDKDSSQVIINEKYTQTSNYGQAKFQAEMAFFEQKDFTCTAVRLPIVMGGEDYTERLKWHVDRIKHSKEFIIPYPEGLLTCINVYEAAKALVQLGVLKFHGPLNIAGKKPLKLRELFTLIEKKSGGKFLYTKDETLDRGDEGNSPYGIKSDWVLNTTKAQKLGISIIDYDQWLDDAIDAYLR